MRSRQIRRFVGVALVTAIVGTGCITIELASVPTDARAQPSPIQTEPRVATAAPSMTPSDATAAPSTDTVTPTHASTQNPSQIPTETPTERVSPTATPTAMPTSTPSDPPTGGRACADDAYTLNGERWDVPFVWFFNDQAVPRGLDAERVVEVIERSFDNIANVRNDCGLPDNVEISSRYGGPTTTAPCPDRATDEINVIGFDHLPPREANFLAYVCPYEGRSTSWRTDMVINADVAWALSLEDCTGFGELLEATITHEVGHIFGLGHVGERRHALLTMSTRANGACATDEITLGLGDVLGLEAIYSE